MSEKWNRFIAFIKPYTNESVDSRRVAIESALKLQLGWLGADDYLKLVKVGNSVVGITLYVEAASYPIVDISFFDTKDENDFLCHIDESMKQSKCMIGINFSKDMRLFYKVFPQGTPLCLNKIALKENNVDGADVIGLLQRPSFEKAKIMEFFQNSYKSIGQTDRLLNMLSDSQSIKGILCEYLQMDGYDDSLIKEAINKIVLNVSLKDEQKPRIKKQYNPRKTVPEKKTRDNSLFSFDGINYYNKRNFVLNVVRLYVSEHKDISYNELEKAFPSEIASKTRGIVRPIEFVEELIKSNSDVESRYCLKDNEMIELSDGSKVVVNNQWGSKNFPVFLDWIRDKYGITTNRNSDTNVKEQQNLFSAEVQEHSTGLYISRDSMEKFSKKKKK